MARLFTLMVPAALCLAGCWPEKPVEVTVTGYGAVEVEVDSFSVGIVSVGYGQTQAEALGSLNQQLTDLRSELVKLEGIESLKFNANQIEVTGIADPACAENFDSYRTIDKCPPVRYTARIYVGVSGSPAKEAGNIVSLATELTTGNAEVNRFTISDQQSAEDQATQAAFANARAKAQQIAQASGLKLGPVKAVLLPDDREYFYDRQAPLEDRISVTASRVPQQTIEIDVPTQTVSAEFRVTFELLEPEAESP
ncbi:MAG: SIMPL domain-containing protein [Pseudomonadota bacterium]